MRHLRHITTGLASIILLTGCATTNHTFRNREFDYLHTTVSHYPTPKIPAGLISPHFSPALTIPKGQSVYPPQPSINLLPPGIKGSASKTDTSTMVAAQPTTADHTKAAQSA